MTTLSRMASAFGDRTAHPRLDKLPQSTTKSREATMHMALPDSQGRLRMESTGSTQSLLHGRKKCCANETQMELRAGGPGFLKIALPGLSWVFVFK